MNEGIDILLADDNEDEALLTMRFLNTGGNLKVKRVKDGEELLDFMYSIGAEENQYPHLIILDLKMPKITGIEVIMDLKSNEQLKNIPIVVLTSSNNKKDIDTCYHLGVNSYILKPIDYNQFREIVQSIRYYWLSINKL